MSVIIETPKPYSVAQRKFRLLIGHHHNNPGGPAPGRLNGAFGLSPRRAPAYSSIRFILRGLDADELERAFRVHASALTGAPAEGVVETEWQPFIKTIVRVTRHTLLRSAATGLWHSRGEVAYYVSSADGLPATAWAAAVRGHWAIENRNHYVRDVSCEEDKSRIRHNPGIMARARSFALDIVRKNGVTTVAQALWNGAISSITSWPTRPSDQH